MSFFSWILIGAIIASFLKLPILLGVAGAIFFYIKHNLKVKKFSFNQAPPGIATYHHHLFSLLGFIAKADGVVSSQEINMANQIMSELAMNHTQRVLAKKSFQQGRQGLNLANLVHYLKILKHSHPQLIDQFINYQERMIASDNRKSIDQINILNQIKFHLNQQRQHTYTQQPIQNDLNDAYKTIGIHSKMPFTEMKKAYRKLIGRHHPDRKRTDAEKQSANEMIKKIQSAWKTIEQHHAKDPVT